MRPSRLFQTCFFTKRLHTHKRRKKYKKHQTQANNFHPLKKDFALAKSCFLCYFLFAYFCFVSFFFFCLRVFLCTYISFVSLLVCACKFFCIFSLKKIINRYGLDGLIYQYYWRDSYRPSYEKFICTHLFLFV